MDPIERPLNIVLIGATGRVGRLVSAAFQAGYCGGSPRIWLQSRHETMPENTRWFTWSPLSDHDGLVRLADKVGKLDCVINLAGSVGRSNSEPLDVNSSIALAVINAGKRAGHPTVLCASSAAVYGIPTSQERLREASLAHPVSDYGRAKLEMEQVVLKQDYPVSCLRIGNVAGADQLLENAARLLPEASLVLDRFSDGKSPVRSYIGPATLAQLLNSLAEAVAAGRTLPELMNISAPQPVAMAQLLEAGNINFTYREALPGAIPSVVLATDLVEDIHRFGQNDSAPTEMYRQWQDLRNI